MGEREIERRLKERESKKLRELSGEREWKTKVKEENVEGRMKGQKQ